MASSGGSGTGSVLLLLVALLAGCSTGSGGSATVAAPTGNPAATAATGSATRSATPARSAVPSARPSARPTAASLAGRTVVLDAGHNGGNAAQPARASALVPAGGFRKPCNTTGTSTDAGYSEHAFTFDVVHRAAALLRSQGVRVVLTRTSDTGFGPCVNQRAAIGNAARADAVVAVHADGGPASGRGFHVIAPALAPDRGNAGILAGSSQLALDLRSAFRDKTDEPYADYIASQGLVRRSDLAGLNLSRVPAVFVECGNMRNRTDAALLTSPAWRQRAATGIVGAVEGFLRTQG